MFNWAIKKKVYIYILFVQLNSSTKSTRTTVHFQGLNTPRNCAVSRFDSHRRQSRRTLQRVARMVKKNTLACMQNRLPYAFT